MTKKLFILFLFFVPLLLQGQGVDVPRLNKHKHRIYAEFSTYLFVSTMAVNYEPTLFESTSRHFRLNGRLGLGLGYAIGFDGDHGISGALGGLTVDFGRRNDHFVLSSGIMVGSNFNEIGEISAGFDRIGTAPLLEIGWRYEKPEGGIIYKIAGGSLGLSVGIGYSF